MRPRLIVRLAFLLYVTAIAALFALITYELFERTLHAMP